MLSLVLLLACAPQPSPADHAPPPAPLTLEVGPIRPGRVASWTVRGLNPGEDVYIGRGPGLSTHGPCLAAAGGLCLDIAGPPALLGVAHADATGAAELRVSLPAGLPVGLDLGFQAVAVRGLRGASSVSSNAVGRRTAAFAGVDVDALPPGGLRVTEVLPAPSSPRGEWFELLNPGADAVELFGLDVQADGGGFRVTEPRVIPAGGRIVLGDSGDTALNGGVQVDYAADVGPFLGDAEGWLSLTAGGGAVDAVSWGPGHAVGLAYAADGSGAWCASAPTPGASNPVCPACGDGRLDEGETCDDGNTDDGDGCDAACAVEACVGPVLGRWSVTASPAASVQATADGAFVISGAMQSYQNIASVWGGRVDADGVGAWATLWSAGTTKIYNERTLPAPDGGMLLVGRYYESAGGAQVDYAVTALRIAPDGTALWAHRYSYLSYWSDTPADAVLLPDGGAIIVGESSYDPFYHVDQRGLLMRVDAAGDPMWSRLSTTFRYARGILALRDGTFMVNGSDWALRMNSGGGVIWARRLLAPVATQGRMTELASGDIAIAVSQAGLPGVIVLSHEGGVVHHTGVDLPENATMDGLELGAVPPTCEATPGAACAVAGARCASGADLCACDGTWTCAPGQQDIALGWHGYGVTAPGSQDGLITRISADGAETETVSVGPWTQVGSLTVDPLGAIAITGTRLAQWDVVRTDADLAGCGVTARLALAPYHATVTTSNTQVTTFGSTISMSNHTWAPAETAPQIPTRTEVCADAACAP